MSEGTERSRKDLLKAAGVAAGALVGGALVSSEQASAADQGSLTLGSANTATNKTSLATSGTPHITDDGALSVTGTNADYGVYGEGASYGVVGSGPGGVLGMGTVGGVFSGSSAAINLDPQTAAGAPAGQAFKGDLAVDVDGVLWLCVADGTPATPGPPATPATPATWIRVSHVGTRLLPSPQRAYSSTDVGSGARLNQGETRQVPITKPVTDVPSNALGVVVNITVHSTVGGGFLKAYPGGAAPPATSSINWGASGQSIANGATIGLGSTGAIALFADAGVPPGSPATHVIVDVTAYIL